MTTMRSIEPLTGSDAVLAQWFPFLGGTPPEPGEHGVDRHMRVYVWQPEGGWAPDLPWWGSLPGMHAKAEAHWAGTEAQPG